MFIQFGLPCIIFDYSTNNYFVGPVLLFFTALFFRLTYRQFEETAEATEIPEAKELKGFG